MIRKVLIGACVGIALSGVVKANAITQDEVNTKRIVNDLNVQAFNCKETGVCNVGYNNIMKKVNERKYIEEQVNKRLDNIEKRRHEEEERKESYNIPFELTYYSLHPSENSGHDKTAYGYNYSDGIVASNYYPKDTIIEFEDGQRVVVADKGGNDFNSPNRLDVLVMTYDLNLVNNMGRKFMKGKVVK